MEVQDGVSVGEILCGQKMEQFPPPLWKILHPVLLMQLQQQHQTGCLQRRKEQHQLASSVEAE